MSIFVSIIVCSYNKAEYIIDTVNSVLNNNYNSFELIIVDDSSTDNTLDLLISYAAIENVRVIKNEINRGANFCRNQGLKNSRGKYIIFLDADDLLDKNCIENRVNFISKNDNLDFAVFKMQSFKKNIGDLNYYWIPVKDEALERFLSHQLPWQTMQPIWKKESLLRLGGFDESFVRLQDVELHTRAIFKGFNFDTVALSEKPDCFYRVDEKRINNYYRYIDITIKGIVDFYTKFKIDARNRKMAKFLFFTLIEITIFLETFIKNNQIDRAKISLYPNDFNLLVNDDFNKKYTLSFIRFIYRFLPFYPKGLKRILKYLILKSGNLFNN